MQVDYVPVKWEVSDLAMLHLKMCEKCGSVVKGEAEWLHTRWHEAVDVEPDPRLRRVVDDD